MNDNIEVVLFEKQHAYDIKLQARDEYMRESPGFDEWMEHNAKGAGFTGIRKPDGKILICAGIRVIESGEGLIWGLFSDETLKYKKTLMRDGVPYIENLIKKLNLRKVIAYVRCDQKVDIRFIERIGFERDGLIKLASWDKKDYYIYSIEIPAIPELTLRDKLNIIEKKIKEAPDVQYGNSCPLTHSFAKGLYIRKITVPAGKMLISKVHKDTYAFFILEGEFETITKDGVKRITAPDYMIMTAGERHNALTLKDTVVVTVHATEETDIEKVENELVYQPFNSEEYRELTQKVILGNDEGDYKKWIEMKDIGEMYGHNPLNIIKDLIKGNKQVGVAL